METVEATHAADGKKVYTSIYGKVEITIPKIAHTFVNWKIVDGKTPTETETGLAKAKCAGCDEEDTKVLPVLTDTSFWTKTVVKEAAHGVAGTIRYSSAFLSFEVPVPALEHTWSDWTIQDPKPTATNGGTAKRTCECGAEDTVTLPALTDTTVWTVGATEPADYNHGTRTIYSSEYGTVTVEADDRLVPPYAEKTYVGIVLNRDEDTEGLLGNPDRRENVLLAIGANGCGKGTGYPFFGDVTITVEDAATGRVTIRIVRNDEDGNCIADDTYAGYVDFVTGIIIRAKLVSKPDADPFENIVLMTPFEADGTAGTVAASAWTYNDGLNAMAIQYTFGETVYSAFIADGKVTFGVTFTDLAGNAISAAECYHSTSLIVKNADGEQLAAFGYDGTRMRVLDGTQGTYIADGKTFILSGFGTLTYNDGTKTLNGTYTKAAEGAAYGFDVTLTDENGVKVAYGHLTLSGDSFNFTKPSVRITFEGDDVSFEPIDANVSVPVKLPKPATAPLGMKFVGWADADGKLVADPYIPSENVTLTAVWKQTLKVVISGLLESDEAQYGTIYPAAGSQLGEILPNYTKDTIDWANFLKFVDWYYDANGNGMYDEGEDVLLDLTMELEEDMAENTIRILAVWKEIPPYYGTFYGTEIWSATSGNSSKFYITIDLDGAISGSLTGTVVSYDAATQLLTVKIGDKNQKFYFNAEAGILARHYSGNDDLGTDIHIMSRVLNNTDYIMTAHYGVKCVNPVTGTGKQDCYARVVVMKTMLGDSTIVFVYNNRIYHNVTVTNGYGEAVAVTDIKNQNTLVVKDAEGNVLFAVKSVNANFASSDTSALDEYYGAYTNGADTIYFDGTGKVKWTDGTIGTYEWVSELQFNVFVKVDDVLTCYLVTATAEKTYTATKPMTEISFVVPAGLPEIAPKNYNSNVTATLPDGKAEGYVFNGYYFDAAFTQKVPEDYKPTGDRETLYAKYSQPAILKINRNNGCEQEEITYSVGDIVTIENPKYAGHRFLGWYTTATLAEGTEWTGNGKAIAADTVIYAKWGDPVNAWGSYNTSKEAYRETDCYSKTGTVTVDEDGNITTSDGYTGVIGDVVCGTITLTKGTSSRVYYYVESLGLFVRADNDYRPNMGNDGWFYFEGTVSDITAYGVKLVGTSTYARLLSFKRDEVTYFIFVQGNIVYPNVTITDAFGATLAVAGIKESKTLTVKDSDGTVIFSVAATGTKFSGGSSTVALDGLQGTYNTADAKTVELDGAGNIKYDGKSGTYTEIKGSEDYAVYLNGGKEYWVLTFTDGETKTATMTKPMTSISFDTDGGNTIDTVSTNTNIAYTLPTPSKAGYKFRGWYIAGDEGTLYNGTYKPETTDAVTLIAKWDVEYTLKVIYGNGMEDRTLTYGDGDITAPVEPTLTNGKVFDHWELTDGTLYTPGEIHENTEIKCIWKDAHPMTGSYNGAEVWGTGNSTISSSSGKAFTIDANGKMIGTKSAVEVEYDSTTGFFKAWSDTAKTKYYYGYYDAENGLMVVSYSSIDANATPTLSADFYVLMKDGSNIKATGSNIDSGKTKVLELTGTVNGESITTNVLVMNNKVWYNVTFTTADGTAVAAKSIYSNDTLKITAADETVVAQLAKINGAFVPLDGTQGTRSGILGNLVSNGAGTVTVGEDAAECAYVLNANGTISFNYGNRHYCAQLTENGYTLVQDGYAGDYTLPDDTTVYTLDGLGNVKQDGNVIGTYAIDGSTLTVHLTEGGDTAYGIDKVEKKLLGKSKFAGYTFSGSFIDKLWGDSTGLRMEFEDSPEIKGTIYSGYGTTNYFKFELVSFEDNVLVVKITNAIDSAAVGKTVTLTLSGKTLTVTATTITNQVYSFDNNGSMTCESFPG